jgi:DNA-binding response OmpR family regulator
MTETILIIEDDASILRGLEMNLGLEGYALVSARDGSEGLRLALQAHPDLILLDIMLPKRDGFEVIREIRDNDTDTPIVVLSARGEEADKLLGLSLGADDYVTKPFSLPELLARIRTALRRQRRTASTPGVSRFGTVVVDFASRRLTVNDQPVDTTAREFELLWFFVTHDDLVVTRNQILLSVWGPDQRVTERTVDNFVARLRQKIEQNPDAPSHFETIRGVGYRFCAAGKH